MYYVQCKLNRLEIYFFTEFVDFNIEFTRIVVMCYFLSTLFRFTFHVELVVHRVTTVRYQNDMCVHYSKIKRKCPLLWEE
jgi:hypothetical protein